MDLYGLVKSLFCHVQCAICCVEYWSVCSLCRDGAICIVFSVAECKKSGLFSCTCVCVCVYICVCLCVCVVIHVCVHNLCNKFSGSYMGPNTLRNLSCFCDSDTHG